MWRAPCPGLDKRAVHTPDSGLQLRYGWKVIGCRRRARGGQRRQICIRIALGNTGFDAQGTHPAVEQAITVNERSDHKQGHQVDGQIGTHFAKPRPDPFFRILIRLKPCKLLSHCGVKEVCIKLCLPRGQGYFKECLHERFRLPLVHAERRRRAGSPLKCLYVLLCWRLPGPQLYFGECFYFVLFICRVGKRCQRIVRIRHQ